MIEAPGGSGPLRHSKRSDRMVDEVKAWLSAGRLAPGDRLPKEAELQALFGLSKGSVREALKSLEVQGLVTLKSGPNGGATIVDVPFERAFQLLQNYFFSQHLNVRAIYALRKLLEPELAAGAVPHLGDQALDALQRSIDLCSPSSGADPLRRRQEDLTFHDILAAAHPNALLRFLCQWVNELLRRMVTVARADLETELESFGRASVAAHRAILRAIRARDADRVRTLMRRHLAAAERHLVRMEGAYQRRLVLDEEMVAPRSIPRPPD